MLRGVFLGMVFMLLTAGTGYGQEKGIYSKRV